MIRLPERKPRSETRSAIRRTPLRLDRQAQIERLAAQPVDVLVSRCCRPVRSGRRRARAGC
ncbi:hypothetical protein, partial [Nonomuraea sp. NPDC001023]|uniref:hypothetical protein n=1 Tax=Nonomuraea sp. NPDC001023 TaxID=3154770 RepID=UPI00332E35B8